MKRRQIEVLRVFKVALLACSALGLAMASTHCDNQVVDAVDGGAGSGGASVVAPPPMPEFEQTAEGWTDLTQFLVVSDGSRSLGEDLEFNDKRDQGTKIVYFDVEHGDNATAEVYFWNGTQIVDQRGNSEDPETGEAYGANPLEPNEVAIRPFRHSVKTKGNAEGDLRLRTHKRGQGSLAGGYPDWFLYRRGQRHYAFDGSLCGGRSEKEPMVIAGYGPVADGRARIHPDVEQAIDYEGATYDITTPIGCGSGGDEEIWVHQVLFGLDIDHRVDYLGAHNHAQSFSGGPPTLWVEDCAFKEVTRGGKLVYLPSRTTLRRSIIGFTYDPDAHNQGYFTSGFRAYVTFDEVIFYKSGYKEDPRLQPDPKRTIFDRNVYQNGGARLGHVYRNVVFADGGSGAPQMRYGGVCENSLIVEGYWYSSASTDAPWVTSREAGQSSAVVRNNVQLVYAYPSPNDPDLEAKSDSRAQPGNGYMLQGLSFGATIEGNIISGALLQQDLGFDAKGAGLRIVAKSTPTDGATFNQLDNVLRNNIVYGMKAGLDLGGNWAGASGIVVEGNVFHAANTAVDDTSENLTKADQLRVEGNRFYVDDALPADQAWIVGSNSVSSPGSAAQEEGWPDPERTLKRYVTEELGLSLLDWEDDPYLDPAAVQIREDAGEVYDPTGLKTFMAVATNMRNGGTMAPPARGKPSWEGDYTWDQRFTALAAVNWIRAGFGLEAVR